MARVLPWRPRPPPNARPPGWVGGGAGSHCGSGGALEPPAGRGGPTLAWTEGRTGLRADRTSLRHARARGNTRAMLDNEEEEKEQEVEEVEEEDEEGGRRREARLNRERPVLRGVAR